MSIYVDLAALDQLVLMLGRLELDADEGRAYVARHTELDYGEGLLNKLRGGHSHVVEEVTTFLATLSGPVAGKTADAVASTIGSYRRGDLESAAQLDAIYGDTAVTDLRPTIGYLEKYSAHAPFQDIASPQDLLKPPADYSGKYPHQPEATDAVSLASLGRDVVWEATGYLANAGMLDRAYDPYEGWIKPLIGDWAGMRACTEVFTRIAAAIERMGRNVEYAASSVPRAWRGDAASACQAHLLSIERPLFAAVPPIEAIASAYERAAEGAAAVGRTLGALLSDVLDAALILMCEIAAAGSTSMTVVGAVLFGGAALYEGMLIVDMVREIIDLVGRASALMDGVSASARDFGIIGTGHELPQLPSVTPLDHAGYPVPGRN